IRRAWGGVGRLPLRCDSAFFESMIVAVAITILARGGPVPPHPRGASVTLPRRRGRERRPALDHRCVEYTVARYSCATQPSFNSLAVLLRAELWSRGVQRVLTRYSS